MGPEDLSHDEFELLARIAHRYYVDGRTQEEIAREFGLSRPKVQRLLERARWSGRRRHPRRGPALAEPRPRGPAARDVPPRRRDRRPRPAGSRSRSGRPSARGAAEYLERRLRDGDVDRRQPRPRRRARCPASSVPGHARLRVRERHGRLAARGHPDEPQRDLPARSPSAAAGRAREPLRPGLRRERGGPRPAPRAGGRSPTRSGRGRPADVALVGHRRHRRRLHDGPQRLPVARRDRPAPRPGAVGDILGNYVDIDGRLIAVAAQRAAHRPVDRRPAPDRDRRGGRQRGREAAGDPRRPARRASSTSSSSTRAMPGRSSTLPGTRAGRAPAGRAVPLGATARSRGG